MNLNIETFVFEDLKTEKFYDVKKISPKELKNTLSILNFEPLDKQNQNKLVRITKTIHSLQI